MLVTFLDDFLDKMSAYALDFWYGKNTAGAFSRTKIKCVGGHFI